MTSGLIIIHGFVQGVGFRKFVEKEAKKLHLSGWVQNLPDRSVEVNAIGDKKDIEKLISLCQNGSFLAQVERIDVKWGEEEPGDDFLIL